MSNHSLHVKMAASAQSLRNMETALGKVSRGLVVGEANEMFMCGICDGLLREPRRSSSCEPACFGSLQHHIFCRVCYEAALSKEACCPTCKECVDTSKPLQDVGPFEKMVKNTVVRCPTQAADDRCEEDNSEQVGAGLQEACGWTGKLGAMAEHLTGCKFAVTKCAHTECSAEVHIKDVGAHEAECVWRGGECERCGSAFTPGEPRVSARPKHSGPFTVGHLTRINLNARPP